MHVSMGAALRAQVSGCGKQVQSPHFEGHMSDEHPGNSPIKALVEHVKRSIATLRPLPTFSRPRCRSWC
jgi:hypothetical protein